jgi:hypothetical protein
MIPQRLNGGIVFPYQDTVWHILCATRIWYLTLSNEQDMMRRTRRRTRKGMNAPSLSFSMATYTSGDLSCCYQRSMCGRRSNVPLTQVHGFIAYVTSNLFILFMPANFTSVVQPLNQSVIAAFKTQYKKKMLTWTISTADTNPNSNLGKIAPYACKVLQRLVKVWKCEGSKECQKRHGIPLDANYLCSSRAFRVCKQYSMSIK